MLRLDFRFLIANARMDESDFAVAGGGVSTHSTDGEAVRLDLDAGGVLDVSVDTVNNEARSRNSSFRDHLRRFPPGQA
jgi:hypothetical protein